MKILEEGFVGFHTVCDGFYNVDNEILKPNAVGGIRRTHCVGIQYKCKTPRTWDEVGGITRTSAHERGLNKFHRGYKDEKVIDFDGDVY